jgi:hypothetical protein
MKIFIQVKTVSRRFQDCFTRAGKRPAWWGAAFRAAPTYPSFVGHKCPFCENGVVLAQEGWCDRCFRG